MRYSNLKKLAAVVLSIGMVFSSSAVTGFSADNSKMIPTIAESSYSQAAAVMDEEYAYDGTYVDNWGDTRKGSQLGVTYIMIIRLPQQLLIIRTAIKHKHIIFRIHIRLLSVKMESIHILQTLLQYHLKVGITTGTYMLIQQKPILFTG